MIPSIRHVKELTFWHYQIAGWSAFFVVQLLVGITVNKYSLTSVILTLNTSFLGFILTLFLRALYRTFRFPDVSIFFIIVRIAAAAFLATLLWLSGMIVVERSLLGSAAAKLYTYRWALQSVAFLYPIPLGWSGLYIGIKYWLAWYSEKEKTEEAEALAHRSQFQMLRYQLNPHFLFNALNAIRALIDEEMGEARRLITELSEFLRYALLSRHRKSVPLREELDAVRHYLAVEQCRYEKKLEVSFTIGKGTEDFPVPSFIVHPLVENALKHGMKTSPLPLRLTIDATLIDNHLRLSVINTGRLAEDKTGVPHGGGTGLEQLRNRCREILGDHYSFDLFEQYGCVHALLDIEWQNGADYEEHTPRSDR